MAIVKRCGWYDLQVNLESKSGYIGKHPLIPSYALSIPYQGYYMDGSARFDFGTAVPNYLESLDAMYQAEQCLENDEWIDYTYRLSGKFGTRKRGVIHIPAYEKSTAYFYTIT